MTTNMAMDEIILSVAANSIKLIKIVDNLNHKIMRLEEKLEDLEGRVENLDYPFK